MGGYTTPPWAAMWHCAVIRPWEINCILRVENLGSPPSSFVCVYFIDKILQSDVCTCWVCKWPPVAFDRRWTLRKCYRQFGCKSGWVSLVVSVLVLGYMSQNKGKMGLHPPLLICFCRKYVGSHVKWPLYQSVMGRGIHEKGVILFVGKYWKLLYGVLWKVRVYQHIHKVSFSLLPFIVAGDEYLESVLHFW